MSSEFIDGKVVESMSWGDWLDELWKWWKRWG
jgi:hypothetical protein